MTIDNNFDALVMALKLAIDAPSDEKAKEVSDMAEQIAAGMSEIEVERAKREALKALH
jgi:hypothetical protein